MKYNFVSLPAARKYSEEAFPYACIAESALLSGVFTMYICSEPFYFSAEEQNVRTIAGAKLRASKLTNGSWSDWDDITDLAGTTGFLPFWCNVAILFENGAVYLEGSKPRTEAVDIRRHFGCLNRLVGFAIGLAMRPVPKAGKHQ